MIDQFKFHSNTRIVISRKIWKENPKYTTQKPESETELKEQKRKISKRRKEEEQELD